MGLTVAALYPDDLGESDTRNAGAPVAFAQVQLIRGSDFIEDTQTDADGLVTFESVPPGLTRLRVREPLSVPGCQRSHGADYELRNEGETIEVRLDREDCA